MRADLAAIGASIVAAALLSLPHHDPAYGVPTPNDDKPDRSWPMFGGGPSRNMVNTRERDLPATWCVQEGKRSNIKWVAEVGNRTIGSPVVADGKVFVATNNAHPRDPNVQRNKGIIMVFRESDGQFLYQIVHDAPEHWKNSSQALPSPPTVAGGHLFYLTSAGEVACADTDDGKLRWRFDVVRELKVHLYRDWCPANVPAHWPSPLVVDNLVFTATGNGTSEDGDLASPLAPSFIALDKRNGKLVWQSNLPGKNLIQAAWSSPAFAAMGGRRQVLFAGGDGVIYSFVPETGELLWRCDCLPMRTGDRDKGDDTQFIGMPVVVGDRLYIGLGVTPGGRHTSRSSYFLCLDITRKGDVSLKSYDAKDPANKGAALVWAFGGPTEPKPERGRQVNFGSTASTAAVHQGLVYITETAGYLYCLDAATGNRIWVYDLATELLGSPYLVDGRVYVGSSDGEVVIFGHTRAARVHATIDMDEEIQTTPVAANGTLYVATRSKLYAIGPR